MNAADALPGTEVEFGTYGTGIILADDDEMIPSEHLPKRKDRPEYVYVYYTGRFRDGILSLPGPDGKPDRASGWFNPARLRPAK